MSAIDNARAEDRAWSLGEVSGIQAENRLAWALRDLIAEHERVVSQWEYGIRAGDDDDPYSDISEDLEWLLGSCVPILWMDGEHVVRRRKAGAWERMAVHNDGSTT